MTGSSLGISELSIVESHGVPLLTVGLFVVANRGPGAQAADIVE